MDENTDPAVLGALISLRAVNRSMLHPHDRRDIVLTFRRLVKSGVEYNPERIYKWLLNDGWLEDPASEARRIAKYEKDYATLKDYLETAIDYWRDKGKANT